MRQTRGWCAVLIISAIASACGGERAMVTAPTPSPLPTAPTTVLTGQVIDRVTSAPMAGASVVASFPTLYATTDSLGNYSLSDLPAWFAYVWATADNYESDVQKYGSAVQNFRLHPIRRIMAGDSTVVILASDDPLCNNNIDSPGWGGDMVCRIVRVVAPTDGTMTIEALSTRGGARPPLVVETGWGQPHCCSERRENPTSIKVTRGTEVIAHIEMVAGSPTSEPFTVTTSMSRQ